MYAPTGAPVTNVNEHAHEMTSTMGPLALVALPLIGALLAIAIHQIALGRSDRTYYRAAVWSLWSGVVVAVYWLAHFARTDAEVITASRALYTVIAAGLPVGVSLISNLHEGTIDRRALTGWYAGATLVAVTPLVIHLIFPERLVLIEDLLAGPSAFATVGPVGVVVLVPALPVMVRLRGWLRMRTTKHQLRIRAARVMVPLFAGVAVNDTLVLVGGVPSILMFPFVATLQAFVLHGLLVFETTQVFRNLETAVAARTTELETQRGELRRAIANLRTVMTGLPDGVLGVANERIVFANEAAARLLGCRPMDLLGASIAARFGTDQIGKLTARAIASDHLVGPLELQLGDPGSTTAVEIDALGIELAGQRTALVIIRDVSERVRMREQLLRSDRLASLGTLVAGVAHEINNPLAYVLGNLEMVKGKAELAPELLESLDEAVEGAWRIQGIVDGMRTFARPETTNVSDVDLRDVVSDALKLTSHTVKHQAHLEVELGDVPSTRANRARLGQVAINLIMNAVQAPRPEGRNATIKVMTCTGPAGDARLEIHDNGIGMSREVLARVFDPFFTTKAVGAGTGLGLSISHGIATAFGGTVELASVEGEGTVARLVMPATGPIAVPPVAATPEVTSTRTARVLIIDDEPAVAQAMGRMLKEHDVHVVEDVAQIEASLASGPFDLVLCDLMMPGLTGMELHARLAREAPTVAERMLFMTGGAFTPEAQEFAERMSDRCVLKPISMATLRGLVDKALASTSPPGSP